MERARNVAPLLREEQTSRERTAPGSSDGNLHTGDLPLPCRSADLVDGFPDMAEPVQSAGGELAAGSVEGKLTVAGDARAALDERAAFALPAETQRLDPCQGQEGETVVELHGVDVARL